MYNLTESLQFRGRNDYMDLAKILSPPEEEKQGSILQPHNAFTEKSQNSNVTQNAQWVHSDSNTQSQSLNGKPNWKFLSQLPAGFQVLGDSYANEPLITSITEHSAKKIENNEPFNRLDLLVQADAILMEKSRQLLDISKSSQIPDKSTLANQVTEKAQTTLLDDSKKLHVPNTEDYKSTDSIWCLEEEEYAAALIYFFFKGTLDIDEGTLLCNFLAQQLRCSIQRIVNKLGTREMATKHLPPKIDAVGFRHCDNSNSTEKKDMGSILHHLRYAYLHKKVDNKDTNANGIKNDGHRLTEYRSFLKSSWNRVNKNIVRDRPCIVRTGFITEQEEMYTKALIESFCAGVLSLADGQSLIEFLCQALKCTPRELSLKFAHSEVLSDYVSGSVTTITFQKSAPLSDKFIEVPAILELMRQAFLRSLDDAAKQAEIDTALLHQKTNVNKITSPRSNTTSATRHSGVTTVAMHEPSRFVKASRSGPWSKEEEAYSAELIRSFCDGALELAESTTLRAFLASRLGCNPMRVSKKLATGMIGDLSIPKRSGSSMFVRKNSLTKEHISETQQNIDQLYQNFTAFDAQKRNSNARSNSHLAVKKRAHSDTSQKTQIALPNELNQTGRRSKKLCISSWKDTRAFDQTEAHYTHMTGANGHQLHSVVN